MKLEELQKIANTRQATPGMGLALDHNGLVPPTVLAPSPTNGYYLRVNTSTNQGEWAVVTIPTVIAPTHLPGGAVWTSNSTLVANQAYLIPIPNVITVTSLTRLVFGGSVSSGNMDLGIYYSDDESTFTRLFSTGSFAVPALGAAPSVKTVAAQTITPVAGRRWYYALAADNATANFAVQDQTSARNAILGYFKTTSFALPSSLTGMTAFTTTATVAPVVNGAV